MNIIEDYLDIENYYILPIRHACISVAVELGLFEAISTEQIDEDALAKQFNLNRSVLLALVESLKSLGFLEKSEVPLTLTNKSKNFLLKFAPFYQGYDFLRKKNLDIHERLKWALTRGEAALKYNGQSMTKMWEAGAIDSKAAEDFTNTMHRMMTFPARYHSQNSLIKNESHIIDLGGGSGAWAIELSDTNPEINVTIFDLPEVIKVAKEVIKNQPTEYPNISYASGSFFSEKIPSGSAFLLSNILHDWPSDQCDVILQNIRNTMKTDDTLYIHECLLDEDRISPIFTSLFNLLMAVNHNSQQFTFEELKKLLKKNGFDDLTIVSKAGYYSLVSCKKA